MMFTEWVLRNSQALLQGPASSSHTRTKYKRGNRGPGRWRNLPGLPAAMKGTGNQNHTAWLLDAAQPLKMVSPAARPFHGGERSPGGRAGELPTGPGQSQA